MIRKLVPSIIFFLLLVSSSALADIFVTPYGSFNYFDGITTQQTLDIDTGTDFMPPASVAVSQLDNAMGAGIFIGTRSEETGLILGLNLEYIGGKKDELFVVYDEFGQSYTVGHLKIESPALAVGGFIGTIISGLSNEKFQSSTGIEIGVIKPSGTLTLDYHLHLGDPVNTKTETHDFGETSLYLSFLFTEKYSFGDTFGLSGTLGWRSAKSEITTIKTPAMSGGYAQNYGGVFLRLGLDVEF